MATFFATHRKRTRREQQPTLRKTRKDKKKEQNSVDQRLSVQLNENGPEIQFLKLSELPAWFFSRLIERITEAHRHRLEFINSDDVACLVKSAPELRGIPKKIEISIDGTKISAVQFYLRGMETPGILTVPQVRRSARKWFR